MYSKILIGLFHTGTVAQQVMGSMEMGTKQEDMVVGLSQRMMQIMIAGMAAIVLSGKFSVSFLLLTRCTSVISFLNLTSQK